MADKKTPTNTFDDTDIICKPFVSFDLMGLDPKLMRGIYAYGFEKPSAVQQRAIVPFVRGGDILAQAQAGTGKTGAFAIGLLQRVDFESLVCQALLLSPTHELALQTQDVISRLGEHLRHRALPDFCRAFVGGTKVSDDVRKIQDGVQVAVGTPGRIYDLVRRGVLRVEHLKVIVLDEADLMLSHGFGEQVYEIFRFLPRHIQVALFSATMPEDVLTLTNKFMRQPTRILVEKEQLPLQAIRQFYVAVEDEYKLGTLCDLYDSFSIAQSVIFCNSRNRVTWLSGELQRQSHSVSCIHSEMTTSERERVMLSFREGTTRVLLATNVLARGIDVQHVSIVINFDIPSDCACYLHRIGRSGRYGRKGLAINFVSSKEVPLLKALQNHYQIEIEEMPEDFATHLA